MTILSVVTGTYNRLASLQRMVTSARRAIPRGLSYEFVIVDGGSNDGTQDWCKSQGDIRLIEHGALLGAIRAFCDGAKAAQGEYVVLANDDITFRRLSIIAALSHLERTPTCGAVAFADNRTSLVSGDGKQYRVEGMGATTADGRKTMVAYAQVGMFRRWLGNEVGWWGADDPLMGQARVYGGDNFLSAGIWERGYTVDAVPLAVVEDHIERDALREKNNSTGPNDSRLFYTRYPTVNIPPVLADAHTNHRLRILHFPVYEWTFPQEKNKEAGLTEALVDYGLAFEWDYLNDEIDLIELVRAWQPDLLITQIQGVGRITSYQLATMRNAVPGMVIVNWNGDIHETGLTSPRVLELISYIDLQTTVNARVLPLYQEKGVRAAYWQIYYKEPVSSLPDVPAYDALLQMNCYSADRTALIHRLRRLRWPGTSRMINVGVYGNCETANGNTHYDFAAQAALYAKATINIGDTYPGGYAYCSNRVFQCLGAGGFLLLQHSEGLQDFTGLIAGVHYVEWADMRDLTDKIFHWLKPEQVEARQQIAQAGQEFVRREYSAQAQVWKLFNRLLPLLESEGEHATA